MRLETLHSLNHNAQIMSDSSLKPLLQKQQRPKEESSPFAVIYFECCTNYGLVTCIFCSQIDAFPT